MNIKDFFQFLKPKPKEEKISDEVVQKFVRVLESACADEISCKEVFEQLDEFVDKEVRGENAAELMPLLQEHLDLCQHCCDEYEALLNILVESSNQQ